MRWQLILQFTAALAVLFGLGWFMSARYVDVPSSKLVERTAGAEAAGVASNVAVEWERAKNGLRGVAEAAATSPVISSLGAAVNNAEARPAAIKASLEGVVSLIGGRGEASLINDRGQTIAASSEAGMELEKTTTARDGVSGASSVRAEVLGGAAKMVAAAPIHTADGNVKGVLMISTPIDEQKLAGWNGQAPIGTGVALVSKDAVLASTVKDRKNNRPELTALKGRMILDSGSFMTVMRDLPDDAGVTLRVVGLSREDDLGSVLVQKVRFLVLALGVLTIVVMLVGLLFAPVQAAAAESPSLLPDAAMLPPTGLPGQPSLAHPVPMAASAIDPLDALEEATHPSTRSIAANATKPPMKSPEPPSVSPFSATLADTALRAGIEGLPLQHNNAVAPDRSEAFDEIANAVFSSPPRQQAQPEHHRFQPHEEDPRDMPGNTVEVDSNEDLPMPVEHMQLPGLREPVPPRGMGSPSFVRGNRPQPQLGRPAPTQPPVSQSSPGQTLPPRQQQPMGRPAPQAQPQPSLQQPQRGPIGPVYGGSAVPLPSSAGRPGGDEQWRTPSVNQIANATTQPMAMPNQEPRRFTTTGDLPVPSPLLGHNGRESMSSPPLASSRPYVAPQGGGTPLPMTGGGTPLPNTGGRDMPMPFDEEHYRVVYNEFVGSKARLGEAVDNITFEGFSSKLRTSEKELIDRHGCRAVRFQVLVKDRQVSLRPQLVR